MYLQRKYTKEAILFFWLVFNLTAAITNEALAVLNAVFGAFYYLYVAYSR